MTAPWEFDTIARLINAAHEQAAAQPVRTGVIVNGGPMAATRHGSPVGLHNASPSHSIHLTTARSEGSLSRVNSQQRSAMGYGKRSDHVKD
jgi:hypothetical protein